MTAARIKQAQDDCREAYAAAVAAQACYEVVYAGRYDDAEQMMVHAAWAKHRACQARLRRLEGVGESPRPCA